MICVVLVGLTLAHAAALLTVQVPLANEIDIKTIVPRAGVWVQVPGMPERGPTEKPKDIYGRVWKNFNWTKIFPFSGVFPTPRRKGPTIASPPAKSCSKQEQFVLKQLNTVTMAVVGKISTSEIRRPVESTKQCTSATPQARDFYNISSFEDNLTKCFNKLGFTMAVATCWAEEHMHKLDQCGVECKQYASDKCQECLGVVRERRRQCSFTSMGISDQCGRCQHQAYKKWDNTCMMKCFDAFDYRGPVIASESCISCNDAVNKQLESECGIN